jgi:hypothetical protein
MKLPLNISDTYVRRARLQPAMLVALPLALAVFAWSCSGLARWGVLWSVFVWCGGTALMAQVARDRGRLKEPGLYRSWGGKPTTRLLRHRDALNRVVLSRRHKRLQLLVTGVRIPSAEAEEADQEGADQVYDACTAFLLEKTRSKEHFPLVFEENCSYGFRRNLWGMKPLGLLTSTLGLVAVLVPVVVSLRAGTVPALIVFVCGGFCLLLLVGWLTWFTPEWVRIAAEAYAERLLAACENL